MKKSRLLTGIFILVAMFVINSCDCDQCGVDITQLEAVKYKATSGSGSSVYFYVFEFEGHKYAEDYNEHFFVHLASCPCNKKEEVKSSSLFDW